MTQQEMNTYGREEFENRWIEEFTHSTFTEAIMIDGTWGIGKTMLLERMSKKIKSSHGPLDCLTFNAFKYELLGSPHTALLSVLAKYFQNSKLGIPKEQFKKFLKITGALLFMIPGAQGIATSIEKLFTVSKESNLEFTEIAELEQRQENLRNAIEELIPKDRKLILFIDELDRCRPDYALSTLEAIKHLLISERLIVVIATDMKSMISFIKHTYGQDIDAKRYLGKFISDFWDFPYSPVHPYMTQYVHFKKILSRDVRFYESSINFNEREFMNLCLDLFEKADISLRDVERLKVMLTRYKKEIATADIHNLFVLLCFIVKKHFIDKNSDKDFNIEEFLKSFYKGNFPKEDGLSTYLSSYKEIGSHPMFIEYA